MNAAGIPQVSAAATKPAPPATSRWIVLVAISVAMFGNYYVYDSIGPLADNLQRLLGFTDTQIGTLNAIYSFPNIVMVLDRRHHRRSHRHAAGDALVLGHLPARRDPHRRLRRRST